MAYHNRIFNGTKTMSLGDFDKWLDIQLTQKLGGAGSAALYNQTVPWLYRGGWLRAFGVASVPFALVRDGQDVVTSENWDDRPDELEFLADPEQFFILSALALTFAPACYWGILRNRIIPKELKYYAPQTIKPNLDERDGLIGFERHINSGAPLKFKTEDVLYIWRPDYMVEIGEPMAYPARAALSAAGVLGNLDEFVAKFFKSGAIKATIYQVEGNPSPDEKAKLKERIDAFMNGITNAFSSLIFNKGAVTPLVVGDGVKDLENSTLSNEKREDIGAALSVPQTILFSGSAAGLGGGGVSNADERKFAEQFQIPEFKLIARQLNKQLLDALDYKLVARPEMMNVFQEDEVSRSSSLGSVVSAVASAPDVAKWAMENVVRYDLTPEAVEQLDALIAARDAKAAQIAQAQADSLAQAQNKPIEKEDEPEEDDDEAEKEKERERFKKFAQKRIDEAHPEKIAAFKFNHLDKGEQDAIKASITSGVKGAQAAGDDSTAQNGESQPLAVFNAALAEYQAAMQRDAA